MFSIIPKNTKVDYIKAPFVQSEYNSGRLASNTCPAEGSTSELMTSSPVENIPTFSLEYTVIDETPVEAINAISPGVILLPLGVLMYFLQHLHLDPSV